ncbi:hypothetical protein N658DRAFT_250265 [Parathielavia hyrcaniae]|uniref:Uncharacterized protein n=1 Tax=Parathielavia hyrcaniae TaxID=113614 RepID=A0AAN6T511_9PEZI|nr:hypothetical protein N658DRAFT_250265 [Parathielavia hyrcaniae]
MQSEFLVNVRETKSGQRKEKEKQKRITTKNVVSSSRPSVCPSVWPSVRPSVHPSAVSVSSRLVRSMQPLINQLRMDGDEDVGVRNTKKKLHTISSTATYTPRHATPHHFLHTSSPVPVQLSSFKPWVRFASRPSQAKPSPVACFQPNKNESHPPSSPLNRTLPHHR